MDDRQTLRAAWPRAWLMTDARLGEGLWDILERLPSGTGVVLRDEALGDRVARCCRDRGLVLAVSRDVTLAARLGAVLAHNPTSQTPLPVSCSVHNEDEALAAKAMGAALIFVSPIYPTRSHPGLPALGVREAQRLATIAGTPAIALGGMDEEKFDLTRLQGFVGWAGIDAWSSARRPRT